MVTVKTKAGALPEGAELRAAELEEGSEEFDTAKETLVDDKADVETVEEFDEKYGFAALDVTFFVDDEEVEPEGAVSVSIKVKELPENATAEELADSLEISHIKEEEDGTVTVETVATTEGEGTGVVETIADPAELDLEPGTIQVAQEEVAAQFDVDSFSTITLQWEISTKYITANGETYSITVKYGPDAKIPKDANLSVSELKEENEEFADYLEQSREALGLEEHAAVNARMFDISIVDSEDTEVEPQAAVQVEIRLLKEDSENGEQAETEESLIEEEAQAEETENEDGESLSVVHFGDQTEVLSIETAEEDGEQVITFETESFSVYAVVDVYNLTAASLDGGIFAFSLTNTEPSNNCTIGGDWHPQHYGQEIAGSDPQAYDWRLVAEPHDSKDEINRSNATYWKLTKAGDGNDSHYYMQVVSSPNGLNIGKYLAFTTSKPEEENGGDPGAGIRLADEPQAVEIFVYDGGDRAGQVRVFAATGQKTDSLDLAGNVVDGGFDAWRNPGDSCNFTLIPMKETDYGDGYIPDVYAIESNGNNDQIGRATVESSFTGAAGGNDTMSLKAIAVAADGNYTITDNRTFWEIKDADDGKSYIRAVSGENAGKYLIILNDGNYQDGAWRPGFSDTPDTCRIVLNDDETYSIISGDNTHALDFFGGGGQDIGRGFGVWDIEAGNNNQHFIPKPVKRTAITADDDPYNLDGKAFALVNQNFNDKPIAIVSNTIEEDHLKGLTGSIRGEYLYVNSPSDISTTEVAVWRFSAASDQGYGYYYIESGTYPAGNNDGNHNVVWSGQYLNIGNGTASVSGNRQALKINIGGVYPHLNQFRDQISIVNQDGYALNVTHRQYYDGIASWNDNIWDTDADWFQLWDIDKVKVDEDPEFTATKISAQDLKKENDQTIETDGQRRYVDLDNVVIYKSVFVDGAYEDYIIDGHGNAVKVLDKGTKITGHSDSAYWNVRIYYDENDQPTGDYDFYQTVDGDTVHLDPQSGNVIIGNGDDFPGVLMPDKDAEKNPGYSTRIESLDDIDEIYYGINYAVNGSNVTLNTGTSKEGKSELLSFARKYVDDPSELHPVRTISTSGLIDIKMYDFLSKEEVYGTLQGNHYQGGNHYNNSGIASMLLGDDGWPTFQENGGNTTNAASLYTNAHYVGNADHLFLESVYDSTGFYEYNAFNNYAYYNTGNEVGGKTDITDERINPTTPNGEIKPGDFTVYEEMGTPSGNSDAYFYHRGNFFPYNPIYTEPLVEGTGPDNRDWYSAVSQNGNWYDGSGNHLSIDDPRYNGTLYCRSAIRIGIIAKMVILKAMKTTGSTGGSA